MGSGTFAKGLRAFKTRQQKDFHARDKAVAQVPTAVVLRFRNSQNLQQCARGISLLQREEKLALSIVRRRALAELGWTLDSPSSASMFGQPQQVIVFLDCEDVRRSLSTCSSERHDIVLSPIVILTGRFKADRFAEGIRDELTFKLNFSHGIEVGAEKTANHQENELQYRQSMEQKPPKSKQQLTLFALYLFGLNYMKIILLVIGDTKIQEECEAGQIGETDNSEIIHSFAAGDMLNMRDQLTFDWLIAGPL